ncbi:MAG: TonB-dependent receptor [Prevotella sp.]|nr:TonB-dependent receptor [Prevotella sp.]MCD8306317.1 TonB-dependent receptor [Prevotella sp.]
MQKKLQLLLLALCAATAAMAQDTEPSASSQVVRQQGGATDMQFTFTESQLGEDDDMTQNVILISSASDLFASQVGYGFSAMRFRYRALSQKYNDIYINGLQMNDLESGQFRYSLVGGLNNQTRSMEASLPFEDNQFSVSALGGSNNYNFRAGSMPVGHRASILATNSNYVLRGMYTYSSGFNQKGWAFTGNLTYRWAHRGYVKGTFYNALSYFLGVEKIINEKNNLSFATWGNPTERSTQGAATDESYWLANSNYYNPYWGYQGGKIRNSRVVNDFAPSALLTWDFKISDKAKLTTTFGGHYSMYKSTKLNYNNSDNPQPDYWKNLPSSYYDVEDPESNSEQEYASWVNAYEYLTGSEANRQINWDRLYYSNTQASAQGADAMYFIEAKHNDALNLQLNSVLNLELDPMKHLNVGFGLGTNRGRHYLTMEDMLGATTFHNLNTYAIGTYAPTSDEVQYDLDNRDAVVKEGDVFRYDYNINVNKGTLWASYVANARKIHFTIGGRTSYTDMQRDGKMRNGLAANNSKGKSGVAHFLDGGGRASMSVNLGHGHAFSLGAGFETRAPQASTAFAAPEINNDFVTGLRNEEVFSSQVSYQLRTAWVDLSINGYYNYMQHVTEWQNFYFDDINSFSYVSLTNIRKANYGVELGARVKITSWLDAKAFGTISEAKYLNNANVRYQNSTSAVYYSDIVMNKNMRESGTPLTAASLGLSFHKSGWYVELYGKYYDRIYLSWSPCLRYTATGKTVGWYEQTTVDENGNIVTETDVPEQSKGHGGFMMDGSIGHSIYLKNGSMLSINLSVTNILNNRNMVTGGYEQSRSDYTSTRVVNDDGTTTATMNNARIYHFSSNPKKYYAYGTTGMLNITYRF